MQIIDEILDLHHPVGGFSCGKETKTAVLHKHYSNTTIDKVMRCSKAEGHSGDHEDAVCCWLFHRFSDDEATQGPRKDWRTCAECHHKWPCNTVELIRYS